MVSGAFVNGPFVLITSAVSCELGNKFEGSRALSTVTAIIDGTGSIGAAVGPLIVGWISNFGWQYVFYMLIGADLLALLLLSRIGLQEWRRISHKRLINNNVHSNTQLI